MRGGVVGCVLDGVGDSEVAGLLVGWVLLDDGVALECVGCADARALELGVALADAVLWSVGLGWVESVGKNSPMCLCPPDGPIRKAMTVTITTASMARTAKPQAACRRSSAGAPSGVSTPSRSAAGGSSRYLTTVPVAPRCASGPAQSQRHGKATKDSARLSKGAPEGANRR